MLSRLDTSAVGLERATELARRYDVEIETVVVGYAGILRLSNRLDTRTVGNRFRPISDFCDSALGAQALWPACDWSAGPCDYSYTCEP
jgi:hypothetical protein